MTQVFSRWRIVARKLKQEAYTLYLACRDPRVPWGVRVLALCVVGYAFSPIDLIPDWIPVLGYLDDLILVPLGLMLVIKLLPPSILAEHRAEAQAMMMEGRPASRVAAGVIICIWIAGAAGMTAWFWRLCVR